MNESKYGYNVGDIVSTKIELKDERDTIIPSGTLLRIVAIAAKVRMVEVRPGITDNKEYFYNAVIASNNKDFPRIRANFVTIKKVKTLVENK